MNYNVVNKLGEVVKEIELNEAQELENSWINDDIDFDEYDDYYDQD